MFIESDRAEYWENGDPFGQDFATGFPKAALIEMLEAGDCFATGRATACVFHCIRIAEYDLRLLAKMLNSKCKRQGEDSSFGIRGLG